MYARVPLPPLSPTKDVSDYPFFTSGVSRFLWRIYAQRLTPAGRWFAILTGMFVAYGGISLNLQGYVPASYAAMLWIIAGAAMLIYRPRVSLDATMPDRVTAGETVRCDVRVTQKSGARGADLVVLPHRLPMSIDAVPSDGMLLPDLARDEHARVRINLHCKSRGEFVLKGWRVESGFPFGILRAWRTFQQPRRLLVHPTFKPLSILQLPSGRRYQPGGVALISKLGESFEYLGNREYREGDNVRDIDWRGTARANKPIVREWVEEYLLRAAVILDTHVPGKQPRRFSQQKLDNLEHAVSIAAAVSDYMARQDYLVDLFAAGPDLYHLTAGRSLAYLDQILDILACVKRSADEPLAIIGPRVAELLSRISTAICVLLDWDETRRNFALQMRAGGVAVKIIICRETACTIDPANDASTFGPIAVLNGEQMKLGVENL